MKSDPLAQLDTYGWKANIASRILNTSAGLILWCGSNDTLAGVSATSAAVNQGLNVGANVWDDASGMETLLA